MAETDDPTLPLRRLYAETDGRWSFTPETDDPSPHVRPPAPQTPRLAQDLREGFTRRTLYGVRAGIGDFQFLALDTPNTICYRHGMNVSIQQWLESQARLFGISVHWEDIVEPRPHRKYKQYPEQQRERERIQHRAQVKRYRHKYPEKIHAAIQRHRKKYPEQHRAHNRKSQTLHPEAHRVTNRIAMHKRRARKRGSEGTFTAAQFNALGDVCLCCGLTRIDLANLNRILVPDHVIPIAHGGSNDISNIQPLCHGVNGCNNHKGTKHTDYR